MGPHSQPCEAVHSHQLRFFMEFFIATYYLSFKALFSRWSIIYYPRYTFLDRVKHIHGPFALLVPHGVFRHRCHLVRVDYCFYIFQAGQIPAYTGFSFIRPPSTFLPDELSHTHTCQACWHISPPSPHFIFTWGGFVLVDYGRIPPITILLRYGVSLFNFLLP